MSAAGLVVVDKPAGLTSHDVVARVRRLAGTRKVGHAGTLDPMATGVLVLGVERATRLLGHLMLTEKGYDAKMGARPIARTIQEHIKLPLAEELLFGRLAGGGHVRVSVATDGSSLTLACEPTPAPTVTRSSRSTSSLRCTPPWSRRATPTTA